MRLELFTTSNCGACPFVKTMLIDRGLEYEEKVTDKDAQALEDFQSYGNFMGVPVLVVNEGEEIIHGVNPLAFDKLKDKN